MAKPHHKPRTAIRGSVSTQIPRTWIGLDCLLAETGIGKDTLNNLRQRYRFVIPRPLVVPPATGRGGTAFYPPETVTIIRRLQELRQEGIRDPDDCLCRLCREGHPVDILGWTVERIEAMANGVAESNYGVTGNELRELAVALASMSGGRIRLASMPGGRIRNAAAVNDLADWLLSAAAGDPDTARNLEDPDGPPVFDMLRKISGLPMTAAFPLPETALVDLLSLHRLAEIAAEPVDEEGAQVRRDFQTIDRISAEAASVDWNAVRTVAEPNVARVTGAKREPPSWQKRKEQRARALPPPGTVKLLLDRWRSYEFRAMVLAFLIGARRLPGYSKHISELLALTEWALSLFPRNPRDQVARR